LPVSEGPVHPVWKNVGEEDLFGVMYLPEAFLLFSVGFRFFLDIPAGSRSRSVHFQAISFALGIRIFLRRYHQKRSGIFLFQNTVNDFCLMGQSFPQDYYRYRNKE
jgi:hypothetical protein